MPFVFHPRAAMDLSFLPLVNACLNGLCIVLLWVGRRSIKRNRIQQHKRIMISAFVVSSVFLILYVTHKVWKGATAGTGEALHTQFNYPGWPRYIYLFILVTHLILAMTVPIFAIVMIVSGLRRRDRFHNRVAQWSWPIWMYVSITGVVIYLLLYPLNASGS